MNAGPDGKGRYGRFGGRYVPETLMGPLLELEEAYEDSCRDASFRIELDRILRDYVGRPTPLTRARRLETHLAGLRIHLKREDLNHTGAHKINNTVGQALLARRMGKKRIIAETGAGQHGVATATVAALLDLECVIYMGEEDMARQALNVARMRLLGSTVVPVSAGSRTLKDAINEAMRDWVTHCESTHYILGSVLGPHPYPRIVRDFQSVIGSEARAQYLACEGTLPGMLVACVGGGSNSLGLFGAFLDDAGVQMVGVEAAGEGVASGRHAARFPGGSPGVLHGTFTYILQDEAGNIASTHSVSAGLDYPAVGPEHARLRELGRVRYETATDAQALKGFELLAKLEGILPALESAHAVGWLAENAAQLPQGTRVLLNLSGRGDKDVDQAAARLGVPH